MDPHTLAELLDGPYDGHRVSGYLFLRYPMGPPRGSTLKGRFSSLGVMCRFAGIDLETLSSAHRLSDLDRRSTTLFREVWPWATDRVQSDMAALEAGMKSTDRSFTPVIRYLRTFDEVTR